MAKVSSGCGTDNFDSSSSEPDGGPGADEDASYTAELIRDALRDMDLSDSVSAYERRLALREMKAVLTDAYRDLDQTPPAHINSYMVASEHTDTKKQFHVLRAEMLRILQRTEVLEGQIRQHCITLRGRWKACGHRPKDLFEMAVWKKGRGLQPSPLVDAALSAMLRAWTASDIADPWTNSLHTGEQRVRLKNLLSACCVPEARALSMCQDPEEGPELEAAANRLEAAMPEYQAILDSMASHPRDPLPSAVARPSFDAVETFLERSQRLLARIKRWQSASGAPFFVSRGEKLRFGVSPESVADAETFAVILQRSISKCEQYAPCRPMKSMQYSPLPARGRSAVEECTEHNGPFYDL